MVSERTATAVRNGGVAILDTLRAWGVDRVFICPGSTEAPFLDASLSYPDIELVTTSHEAITVSMADGYARMTGRPSVAYVHTHLGLANGLASLCGAQLGRSPVVVVTGLKATSLHGVATGFTTTSDVRELPRQFVKWAHETASAEAIATDLDHALRVAATAPAGPVFLGVAQDRLEADAPDARARARPEVALGRVRPAREAVVAAADVMAGCARPLVVAGAEVFRAGGEAVASLQALADALAAPLVVEDRRTIERAEPAGLSGYAGMLDAGSDIVRDSDLVILAGARTPIRFEHTSPPVIPAGRIVVHVGEDADDLLRGPAVLPLLGDVGPTLADLAAALDARDGRRSRDDGYRERAVAMHRAHVAELRREADERAGASPISVPALMRRLCALLPDDTWIVDDGVTSRAALLGHALAHDAGLRYLATASGSLGWGVGAALGVAEARPGRRVVAVSGDGAFQFGLPGLWTAVDRRLPVTFLVVNNQGYGAVKAALRRFGGTAVASGRYPASTLADVDLAAVARGFGASGWRIDRLDELDDVFARAQRAPGPAVVEVLTDPDDSGPVR